ncbi:penicillin amidase [Stella humosa]|uniref:Penicillin amidase n=1 Tax=Stella humosa TaxID=94 RepID=A0A3N1MD53_9PROT|nr:penicillin acylase family protein [Stella humosa]ROQ01219.1 penicillin amidase [Stella humosa]BBK31593.1 penicillin amidase [Stella humosa]
MAAAIGEAAARAAIPPLDGRMTLAGIGGPVDIFRDQWGVPHIRAGNPADCFFAQGFAHAQDRLWQMDAARRRAVGRYAEWVGPSGVAGDALARRAGIEAASRRDLAAASGETAAMLSAYAAGVNAFIAEGVLPLEYGLLGATPEPWEPWQSIAAMRQRGFLMGSIWFKLWRAAAVRTIGPDQVTKLRYDDGGRDLLCIPPGVEADRWVATLADLGPALEAVAALGASDATGGGSNNWALGPSRTATGRPLLAGDPHRVFEIPSMYAQGHIACPEFDAIGLTVPGVPAFPHFAHNGRVAWCVTHAFMDIFDLFVERFAPGAGQYLFRDEWLPTTRRTEVIGVRGGPAVEIEVVETHHGPVIAGDPASGAAVTLRTVQVAETDRSLDCLLPMLRAGTVDALFEATREWGLIDHNLVAGDVAGRIGHLVRAKVPRRSRINGWLPVPGWTGDHEWQGDIPWEAMPRVFDPPGGAIVTANNRPVADDFPEYLTTDCHPPYRADRIARLLAGLDRATAADMAAIHMDTASPNGILLRDRVARLAPADPAQRALRDRIAGWDGHMDGGSVAAGAYARVRRALTLILADRSGLARAAADPLLKVPPPLVPANQLWWTLPGLLRADDAGLLGGIGWDEAVGQALAQVAAEGDNGPWSAMHQPRFVHPLSAQFPEAAALLDPASRPIGGDNDCVLATGLICSIGLPAMYGAVARYVFDVGNWDACQWAVFHGASGHPGSPNYADQNAAWTEGRLVPMLYGWDRIQSEAAATMELVPH